MKQRKLTAAQLATRLGARTPAPTRLLLAAALAGTCYASPARADDADNDSAQAGYDYGHETGQNATPGSMGAITGMDMSSMGPAFAAGFTEGLADGFSANSNSSISSTATAAAQSAVDTSPAQAAISAVESEFGGHSGRPELLGLLRSVR